jgi:hypothetical protein
MNRRLLLIAAIAATPLAAWADDNGVRKKGGGASFIQLDTLTATVLRSDGRRGVMTVEVGVDVPDPALHARAAQSSPLLRAAYSEVLRTYATGLPPATPPDADYLSRMLQRQTDATLGRPGARLLLGTILVN